MFETFFHEMIETIAGDFSAQQKAFLRFTLRPLYEDKTKALLETLHHCECNQSHLDPEEHAKLKDEVRAQFMLLPLHTTKGREVALSIKVRQEQFRERWYRLALSKGIE